MQRLRLMLIEPGLEVRAPVERVERPENLQKDVLRQVFRFIVTADEPVRDVEDLPPVLPDDLIPTPPDRRRGSARSARRCLGADATGGSLRHRNVTEHPRRETLRIIANRESPVRPIRRRPAVQ